MTLDDMKRQAVSVIVFDVNETLLDITVLEPVFERAFGDPGVLREWFAQLILYSQSLTLAGYYAPFGKIAVAAFQMVASFHNAVLQEIDIDEFRKLMGSMPAHGDAVPALERLKSAGFRLVTLTNSAPGEPPTPLDRAGLGRYFERNFSVDAVRRFKPAPEVYRLVADELDVEPSELCLVACHLWDTIGAQAAGCRGAFVTRPHNAILPIEEGPYPDVVAGELLALAEGIIRRWRPERL